MKKILIWIGVTISALLLLSVGGVILLLYWSSHSRTPEMYLIPADFQGRVTIHYEIPTAPPFPKEGKYIVIRIPTSGQLETSSSPPVGGAADVYYFVDQKGNRTPIDIDQEIIGSTIGSSETENKDGTMTETPPVGNFLVKKKQR